MDQDIVPGIPNGWYAVAWSNDLAPVIGLDAQTYAVAFYESLGFTASGEIFDDAGIPHIHMSQPA